MGVAFTMHLIWGTNPLGCSNSASQSQKGMSLALTPSFSPHPPGSAKAVGGVWFCGMG